MAYIKDVKGFNFNTDAVSEDERPYITRSTIFLKQHKILPKFSNRFFPKKTNIYQQSTKQYMYIKRAKTKTILEYQVATS